MTTTAQTSVADRFSGPGLYMGQQSPIAPLCECGARKEYRVPLERVGHAFQRAWVCTADWHHTYYLDPVVA